MTKSFPPDTLDQAILVLAACRRGSIRCSSSAHTARRRSPTIAQAKTMRGAQIDDLELQLMDLRNQRDDQFLDIWDSVKRVRSTIKGAYGDDAPRSISLVGGTRISERAGPCVSQPLQTRCSQAPDIQARRIGMYPIATLR